MSSATDPARRRINALEVVISLCFTYALCIFGMRLWMRRNLYGLDDLIALIATVSSAQDDRPVFPPDRSNLWLTATFQVLAVAQYATQYLALAVGLGRSSQYLETDSKLSTLNNVGICRFWRLMKPPSKHVRFPGELRRCNPIPTHSLRFQMWRHRPHFPIRATRSAHDGRLLRVRTLHCTRTGLCYGGDYWMRSDICILLGSICQGRPLFESGMRFCSASFRRPLSV